MPDWITDIKVTYPHPNESKRDWIDIYIQEADPDAIAVIELSKGFKAIIDKEYEELVKQYNWFAAPTKASVYAKSSGVIRTVKPQTQVALHNFIVSHFIKKHFDPTLKHTTFHNKNPLDCRVSNLLKGNDRQAVMRNRRGKRDTESRYKGVRPMSGKYRAFIYDGADNISLGSFDKERSAAKIYDAAALVIFGASAHFNFPLGILDPLHHELASLLIQRHYNKKLGRPMTDEEIIEKGLTLYSGDN